MRTTSNRRGPALLLGLTLVFMLLFAACGEADSNVGGSGSQPGPTPTAQPTNTPQPPATEELAGTPTVEPIGYSREAGSVVARIEYAGGFVPQEFLVTRLPILSLYGDGRILTEGPQIAIYPAPALPNIQMGTLTDEGIQMILEAAGEAGLLDGDKHYPYDMIADAATTVFTITVNGETHTVSAYALGDVDLSGMPGIPADEIEARRRLTEFQAKVVDYFSWLPETAIEEPRESFPIERLQIVSRPADLQETADDIDPGKADWPLETPLAEIGEPFEFMEQARCVTLEGAELESVLSALQGTNQLTAWESDGEEYALLLRPILPDEQGCAKPQL